MDASLQGEQNGVEQNITSAKVSNQEQLTINPPVTFNVSLTYANQTLSCEKEPKSQINPCEISTFDTGSVY